MHRRSALGDPAPPSCRGACGAAGPTGESLIGPVRLHIVPRPPIHAVTWLVWAVAAALAVQVAANPWCSLLVLVVAVLVWRVHRVDGPLARALPVLLGVSVAFVALRVVLAVLTTHGVGDPIVTLPSFTLPRLLGGFQVGGTVEAEVLWQAVADGLVVVTTFAVFGAFNAVVSHHQLIATAPRAFHEAGLVLTVGLAFVPATLAAVEGVREADRLRTGGRVIRRGRTVRLLVPVIETGMERALALAESMDARGFARLAPDGRERWAGWSSLVALLALGGSFVALVGRAHGVALLLAAGGVAALVAAVVLASAARPRTRYRPQPPNRSDALRCAAVLVAPLGLAVVAAGDGSASQGLRWAANPLTWPTVHPVVVLLLAALAVPLAVPAAPPVPAGSAGPAGPAGVMAS